MVANTVLDRAQVKKDCEQERTAERSDRIEVMYSVPTTFMRSSIEPMLEVDI